MIRVALDGTGDFFTIQEAVDSISDSKPETIYIKKGVYEEKLVIEKPHLTFIGEEAKETIITFSDYAKKQWNEDEIYQTFRTYTALIGANHLCFSNLTFKNEAGKGSEVGQALALYVDGDCIQFHDCYFLAHQDTLFTGPLPP
ncbi:pectin methylesterase, partial [Turicibacter sanguinis]|nr:pectin methylesterase [Turicibacter sanguinis]